MKTPTDSNKDAKNQSECWRVRRDQLCRYKDQHGDLNVPRNYESNPSLGLWVHRIRNRHARGKNIGLNETQKKDLEDLGFDWHVPSRNSGKSATAAKGNREGWNAWFEKMTTYKQQHGDVNVPQDYNDVPGLSKYVARQRRQYNLKKKGMASNMTDDRIRKLESLGFDWNGPTSPEGVEKESWAMMLDKLKTYKDEHGTCEVPQSYDKRLSNWVKRQKRQYKLKQEGKGSNMKDGMIVKLEMLGFDFDMDTTSSSMDDDKKKNKKKKVSNWKMMFTKLEEYKNEHGDCNVSQSYCKQNPKLLAWIRRQRRQYKLKQEGKKSMMTDERINALNGLGFDFKKDVNMKGKSSWNDMLDKLETYKNEHGDCNVPQMYKQQPRLSNWVKKQRRQYKAKKNGKRSCPLTDERIAALNDLGFVWSIKKHDNVERCDRSTKVNGDGRPWDRMFVQLQAYKDEHGDCNVPNDYAANPKLARWMVQQTNRYAKLKTLGFVAKDDVHMMTEDETEMDSTTNADDVSIQAQEKSKEKSNTSGNESVKKDKSVNKKKKKSGSDDTNKPSRWDEKYEKLKKYKEEHGDCLVPSDYPGLGGWVTNQRKLFRRSMKGKRSLLSKEKYDKLAMLGFEEMIKNKGKQSEADAEAMAENLKEYLVL